MDVDWGSAIHFVHGGMVARLYAAHHSAKRISVERKLQHNRVNTYIIAKIKIHSTQR